MIITVTYTLVILIMGYFVNENNAGSRKRFLILSSVILILISGLRSYYTIGWDTARYAGMFFNNMELSYREIYLSTLRDPIYHIFTSFLSRIYDGNFQLTLITIAVIYFISLDILLYKESPNLLISMIIFLAMGFFFFSMNGVRQSMAMGFIMLSYFPLKNKKLIKFLLLVCLGACFHKTALVFAIAYPICRLGFDRKNIVLYAALITLLFLFGKQLLHVFVTDMAAFDERFSFYAETEVTLSLSGFIQLLLFFALLCTNMRAFLAHDNEAPILINLLIIAIIMQIFAIFIAEMFRVAMYFSLFLVILIPRFLQTYPLRYRQPVSILLCVMLLIYFFITPSYLEYDFFWNDPEY